MEPMSESAASWWSKTNPRSPEPLAAALQREGFAPSSPRRVADGLERFRAERPDLVLLDVMLPDGDGRDLLRQIRAESRTPVIMLTARGQETDKVVGLELGADDYVVKPFGSAELLARIRAVLRRSAAPEAGRAGAAPGRRPHDEPRTRTGSRRTERRSTSR